MSFQKLKFKEIINGEEKQFFINDKLVDENTYLKMLMDDSLYSLPPLPKTNSVPDDRCSANENNEEYLCEECQQFLNIIEAVRELDDNESLELMRDFVEDIKTQTVFQALIGAYSELASNLNKTVARMEIELEKLEDEIMYED